MPFEPTHRVTSSSLNLRFEPDSDHATNRIAVLPQGAPVEKLDEHDGFWWRVGVRLHGALGEGFVAGHLLEPLDGAEAKEPAGFVLPAGLEIPLVHLSKDNPSVTRDRAGGRAHPLGEPGRPGRASADPATRAAELSAIFDWLDVEESDRYEATSRSTYCNIYAYDAAYLADVFLPRVWWTGGSLLNLRQGKKVPVRYDDTVTELNANALYGWFGDFGGIFGWRRTLSLEELQQAANDGAVGMIVARHRNVNRSGHIAVVERETDELRADRRDGVVVRPVTSQAGRNNFRRVVPGMAWWALDQHASWSAWIHD